VRLIVVVVQQTFGGFLNFVPHLHVLVSAGGLLECKNRWIHPLKYEVHELMCAWRYAVITFLSEARHRNVLRSSLSGEELMSMFAMQYRRTWHIFISRAGSKSYRLKHDGRYIRRREAGGHFARPHFTCTDLMCSVRSLMRLSTSTWFMPVRARNTGPQTGISVEPWALCMRSPRMA
jgi:Putative transposase